MIPDKQVKEIIEMLTNLKKKIQKAIKKTEEAIRT